LEEEIRKRENQISKQQTMEKQEKTAYK